MAIYKLIPSSFTTSSSSSTLYDASNAYTDTDSDTYASLSLKYANARGWLGGFNFPTLEIGERIVSIIAKVKTYNSIRDYGEMRIVSNATTSNVVLSSSINSDDCGAYPAEVYTMEWVQDLDTVYSYRDTLCIEFKQNTAYSSGAFTVYGAEIIVETAKIERNKIIYGGETLIDLTSDTVTAADVASGVVFHLPSGTQAIGTLIASPTSKHNATTMNSARSVSFTGLTKEPSYFWIMPMIASATRTYRVMGVVYNDTTTYTMYTDETSAGKLIRSTSIGAWTYNSGTLKFSVSAPAYLGEATWYIWYL